MPVLLISLATGFFGLFAGAQIDDALDKKVQPIGGGTQANTIPYWIQIPLIVGASVGMVYVVKKALK